jgi:signal transduction histidine kinase
VKDEFLANMSHELRTPLTAVMGYISLMEEGVAGPVTSEQQETLTQVKASSQKLVDMISDLLELAALKRGDVTVKAAEFYPRDAVREAVASNAHNARAAVRLVIDDVPVLPMIVSDKTKVTRIVSALICNAYKFTDAGEVKVSVRASGDQIVYRVTDTGIGISRDAQEFVFDEFRQEDGSATRRHGGTGLGLAIARRLARALKGDVTLSSVRGKGSTFVVELPLKYGP